MAITTESHHPPQGDDLLDLTDGSGLLLPSVIAAIANNDHPDPYSKEHLQLVGEYGSEHVARSLIQNARGDEAAETCILEIMKGCLKTCCAPGGAAAAYLFGVLAENYFIGKQRMQELLAASMDVQPAWGALAGRRTTADQFGSSVAQLPTEHPIRFLLEEILPVYGFDHQIEMMAYVARLAEEKGQTEMLDYVSELAWFARDRQLEAECAECTAHDCR